MSESDGFDAVTFSDDEYAEFFGTDEIESAPKRRIGRRARLVGAVAAVAMLAGTATVLIDAIGQFATIDEPAEIRQHSLDRIAESRWGWLASDVVVVAIPEPEVGARVTNNPPDGIITIDRRNWNGDRLDRLVEHELGHLLDFAVWGDAPRDDRRNGLASEAWAECAAVAAGTRRVDGRNADERYHCYPEEFEIYQETVAGLDEVCSRWATPECRPATPDVATLRE